MLYESERIGAKTTQLLQRAEAIYISSVSLWELTLKFTKGKLPHHPKELTQGVKVLGLEKLGIEDKHLAHLIKIDLPHTDPFDRLIVAQAEAENYSLLTVDKALLLSKYRTIDARQ